MVVQKFFDGKPWQPRQPTLLTENVWTLSEMTTSLAKMKAKKCGDDIGIVVECVQFASRSLCRICYFSAMLCCTPALFQAPGTMFIMLEKIRNAKLPSVFRLIASARIIYNDFSYMAQTRAELVLEASQTENNMGFVAAVGRRNILRLQTL